ncbi:putative N6-adenine methyltransferase-domain-containing protein [Xylaria sp. CBS 124048]|nr:putative N6-adenine methyltransferase-domain-containing protein [Xylaria sp. CBS 124048]
MADDTEESLSLSADALAALQEFYTERDAHAEKFEMLKARVGGNGDPAAATAAAEAETEDRNGNGNGNGNGGEGAVAVVPELSIHTFTEDWNESQFWYSDETANLLAEQMLDGVSDDSVIAVVSTPSVFVALKKMMTAAGYTGPKSKTYLLEHDHRFAVFPEFVYYDFAQPFKLPPDLKGTVDRMICDPPFLSNDCQTKTAMTMRWLARNPNSNSNPNSTTTTTTTTPPTNPPHAHLRVLVCTGERMAPLITKLYGPLGVRITTYEPQHGGLKNEFYCYANFECAAWRWRSLEE